jgi:hypothetical protein
LDEKEKVEKANLVLEVMRFLNKAGRFCANFITRYGILVMTTRGGRWHHEFVLGEQLPPHLLKYSPTLETKMSRPRQDLADKLAAKIVAHLRETDYRAGIVYSTPLGTLVIQYDGEEYHCDYLQEHPLPEDIYRQAVNDFIECVIEETKENEDEENE